MELRRILSYARRAVDDYQMIEEGDRIAVGISGGKDSLALLCALAGLRRFYAKRFELMAITIDMGFPTPVDYTPVAELCRALDVPYHIKKTDISTIIFDIRKEKSPCALCSKMRRGVLHNTARELGCNTVALGHHFDDVVNTFMLNLFYEGRLGCFEPISYLDRAKVKIIRPLLYMPEKDVRYFAKRENLPVITSPCPADGNTERANMEKLMMDLERMSKGLRQRVFCAIQKGEIDGFRRFPKRPPRVAIPDEE